MLYKNIIKIINPYKNRGVNVKKHLFNRFTPVFCRVYTLFLDFFVQL